MYVWVRCERSKIDACDLIQRLEHEPQVVFFAAKKNIALILNRTGTVLQKTGLVADPMARHYRNPQTRIQLKPKDNYKTDLCYESTTCKTSPIESRKDTKAHHPRKAP